MKTLFLILALFVAGCADAGPDIRVTQAPHAVVPKWRAVRARMDIKALPVMKSLDSINSYANGFPYVEDATDKWKSPSSFFLHGGDCEDFAIAKYALILRSGLARENEMDIAIVKDGEIDHAILIVKSRYVLDNQTDHVFLTTAPEMSRYRIYGIINR